MFMLPPQFNLYLPCSTFVLMFCLQHAYETVSGWGPGFVCSCTKYMPPCLCLKKMHRICIGSPQGAQGLQRECNECILTVHPFQTLKWCHSKNVSFQEFVTKMKAKCLLGAYTYLYLAYIKCAWAIIWHIWAYHTPLNCKKDDRKGFWMHKRGHLLHT